MDANTNPKPNPNPNPNLNPNLKPNPNPNHSLDNTPCLHSKNAGTSNCLITDIDFKLSNEILSAISVRLLLLSSVK